MKKKNIKFRLVLKISNNTEKYFIQIRKMFLWKYLNNTNFSSEQDAIHHLSDDPMNTELLQYPTLKIFK